MGNEMVFAKAQEKMRIKSNFARTCNRFSQFLKEKRSLGDIDAFTSIASPKYALKVDLNACPTQIQTKPDDTAREIEANTCILVENKKSLDLFPLTSSSSKKDLVDSRETPKPKEESKENTTNNASMTIIYDGKVVVLEDVQEDMAQKILRLASQGGVTYNRFEASPDNNTTAVATTSTTTPPPSTHPIRGNLSDLPIARRTSLHRFMEKRKDRIAACEPYQVKNYSATKELHRRQEEEQLELKLW